MTKQSDLEVKCQKMYCELGKEFQNSDFGFKIFNSPPIYQTPLLFVGYQPGGGKEEYDYEVSRATHLKWPCQIEYLTEDWLLARRMRATFGTETLEHCVGMNAIFLRYPNVAHYKRAMSRERRAKAEAFCFEKVQEIINLIKPEKIVTIGFSTLNLFGPTEPLPLPNPKRRSLIHKGMIGNCKAIAMIHLTGARPPPSSEERDLIRDCVTSNPVTSSQSCRT